MRSPAVWVRKAGLALAAVLMVGAGAAGAALGDSDPAASTPDGGTAADAGTKTIAYYVLTRDQVTHPPPSLPWWFKQKHPHELLSSMYKTCIDESGHVFAVTVAQTIGDTEVDKVIMNQIKKGWTYKPQKLKACFNAVLKFNIN